MFSCIHCAVTVLLMDTSRGDLRPKVDLEAGGWPHPIAVGCHRPFRTKCHVTTWHVDNRWQFREPHCQVWMLVTWQKNHLSSTEQGWHVFFFPWFRVAALIESISQLCLWSLHVAILATMLLLDASTTVVGITISNYIYIDICRASRHVRIEATSGSIMETKTFMILSPGLGLKSFHISHQISSQMDPFTNLRPTKKRFNFSFFPTGSTDPLNRPLWCYGLLSAVHLSWGKEIWYQWWSYASTITWCNRTNGCEWKPISSHYLALWHWSNSEKETRWWDLSQWHLCGSHEECSV